MLTALAPEHPIYWNNLAASLMMCGHGAEAFDCLTMTLERGMLSKDPQLESIALSNILILHMLRGEHERANANVERIKELCVHMTSGQHHYIFLCSQAIYNLRYGSLLEAYHLSCEATELHAPGFRGFALQCAAASFTGDMSSAHQALAQLHRPDMIQRPFMASFIRFSELALELFHALLTSESPTCKMM